MNEWMNDKGLIWFERISLIINSFKNARKIHVKHLEKWLLLRNDNMHDCISQHTFKKKLCCFVFNHSNYEVNKKGVKKV